MLKHSEEFRLIGQLRAIYTKTMPLVHYCLVGAGLVIFLVVTRFSITFSACYTG